LSRESFASLSCRDAFAFGAHTSYLDRELAEVALEAARRAAVILRQASAQGASGVATKTSQTDMVSDVDRSAEVAIAEVLCSARPDDALLGEEGTRREGTSGVRWLVDPLDGTTNFLFGLPQFCVSVAAEVDGHAAVGVVIDPCRDETWTALRSQGAWCNGEPISVAFDRSSLSKALLATGFGYQAEARAWQSQVVACLLPKVRDIRRFGSAALDLCWLAAGRFDAFYEWGLNPWDCAAGALIASQAGATVTTDHDGLLLAAPPHLHEDLWRLLASCREGIQRH